MQLLQRRKERLQAAADAALPNVYMKLLRKSQFSHKFVNLSFIMTNVNNKLTDLC
jgi:hypothetical protein